MNYHVINIANLDLFACCGRDEVLLTTSLLDDHKYIDIFTWVFVLFRKSIFHETQTFIEHKWKSSV